MLMNKKEGGGSKAPVRKDFTTVVRSALGGRGGDLSWPTASAPARLPQCEQSRLQPNTQCPNQTARRPLLVERRGLDATTAHAGGHTAR
jgi:hypothetical protein